MALLDLWREYERETFGKSVIRFTKGLRARLLPHEAEKTDEELAALEVGGVDVVRFAGWFYRKIARVPGLEKWKETLHLPTTAQQLHAQQENS